MNQETDTSQSIQLSVRGIGDLFRDGWKLFIDNIATLIIIYLIGGLIALIVVIPIFSGVLFLGTGFFTLGETMMFLPLIILFILGLFAVLAISVLVSVALIVTVEKGHQGEKIQIGEAFRKAYNRFWPALGLYIVAGMLVLLAMSFFIIPGIIVAIYFYFAMYVLVCENLAPIASLKKSVRLVSGHFWQVFLLALIIGLIKAVASQISWGLISIFLSPFFIAMIFLLYTDLRKQKNLIEEKPNEQKTS